MQTKLLTSFEWSAQQNVTMHADIIKWKHFPCYWPFAQGIHQSAVNSLHKDQWHGALMFSLICTWTNGSGNNWDTSGWRRHCAHYDVTLMYTSHWNYISHHKIYCAGNSPVNSEFPSQNQWHGALMFSLICAWTNGSGNNWDTSDIMDGWGSWQPNN